MNTTTLRGVFPEPKPVYRRNFIKENVRQIKQMQGIIQITEPEAQKKRGNVNDKFRNVPPKVPQLGAPRTDSKIKLINQINHQKNYDSGTKPNIDKLDLKKDDISRIQNEKQKFTSRAMQTERFDDVSKLYETGVIKYPSTNRRSPRKEIKKFSQINQDHGDISATVEELYHAGDNISSGEKADYVKQNIKNLKQKVKPDTPKVDPTQPPPGYQKGVVPKYIREKKGFETRMGDSEPECPPGHILLPEDERKETLRVLRQSYADRVQELNTMPVRSDTLKMKKRKMDIEEELKKIDEGIKVFQRPKVFVKVNA